MFEGALFRRACNVFLGSLILFWAVAFAFLTIRATKYPHSFFDPLFYNNLQFKFSDFVILDWSTFRFPKSSTLPPVTYPAPLMCFYVVFGKFPSYRLEIFETFVAASFAIGAVVFSKALARITGTSWLVTGSYIVTAALLCYPFWFELERANLEIVVWISQVFAVVFLMRRRWLLAAVLIGIAASMKFYPALLLAIPFSRKKYSAIAVSLLAAIVYQLTSLSVLGPTISAANREVVNGLRIVSTTRVFTFDMADSGYEHSLLSIAKQTIYGAGRLNGWSAEKVNSHILQLALPYFALIAVAGLLLYWWRIRKVTVANQIVVLLALSTILPPMALEYALIEITIAWAVYLCSLARVSRLGEQTSLWSVSCVMFLFAVVFSPGFYLQFHRVGIAGEFKLLALCLIVYLVCRYPIPEPTESLEWEAVPQIG